MAWGLGANIRKVNRKPGRKPAPSFRRISRQVGKAVGGTGKAVAKPAPRPKRPARAPVRPPKPTGVFARPIGRVGPKPSPAPSHKQVRQIARQVGRATQGTGKAVAKPRPKQQVGRKTQQTAKRFARQHASPNPLVNPRAKGPIRPLPHTYRANVGRKDGVDVGATILNAAAGSGVPGIAPIATALKHQGEAKAPKQLDLQRSLAPLTRIVDHYAPRPSPAEATRIASQALVRLRAPKATNIKQASLTDVLFGSKAPNGKRPVGASSPGFALNPTTNPVYKAGSNTTRAWAGDPGGVTLKTLKGLGQIAAGTVAAPVQIGIDTVEGTMQGDPLRGGKRLVKAAAKDANDRYGDLYKPGGEERFRKRIQKEGAAPELVDAASVFTGGAATTGRALGAAARTGKIGSRLEHVATAKRPGLQVSGDRTRHQDVSDNLFRAMGQRGEDALRKQRLEGKGKKAGPVRLAPRGRNVKADAHSKPRPGLQPQPGNVVKATERGQRRAQRVVSSAISTQGQLGFQAESHRELKQRGKPRSKPLTDQQIVELASKVGHKPRPGADIHEVRRDLDVQGHLPRQQGAEHAINQLSKKQHEALFDALQGVVNTENPVLMRKHAAERKAQILSHRKANNIEAPSTIGRKDEVAALDFIQEHADEIAGPKLTAIQRAEVARSERFDEGLADTKQHTALRRRHKVQGIVHGFDDPVELGRAQIEREHKRPTQEETALRQTGQVRQRAKASVSAARQDLQRAKVRGGRAVAPAQRRLKKAADESAAAAVKHAQAKQAMKGNRQRKAARKKQALAEFSTHEPRLTREYVDKIKQANRRTGRPDPAYFQHIPRPDDSSAAMAHTSGSGQTFAGASKQSSYHLFKGGLADTSPEAYLAGLSRSVRRKHNWPMAQKQVESASIPHVIDRRAGHEAKKIETKGKSLEELQQAISHAGLKAEDYGFINAGRTKQSMEHAAKEPTAPGEARDVGEGDHAIAGSAYGPGQLEKLKGGMSTQEWRAFEKQKGWNLTPAAHVKELHDASTPSGKYGRTAQKLMGTWSRVLLGTNPTWAMIQAGQNLAQGGMGTRMNPAVWADAHKWFKEMPPDVKRETDLLIGNTGVGQASSKSVSYGTTANGRVVTAGRAFTDHRFTRWVSDYLDPSKGMFWVDSATRTAAARGVFTQGVRHEVNRMRKQVEPLAKDQARLMEIFKLPKNEMRQELLKNPAALRRTLERTDDFMGDWVRFTAMERKVLKRFLPFYGFMRFSLRTAFYVMPVKHPIAGAISMKLGQLHVSEVKDLIGGDDAPWAYSRLFFDGKDPFVKVLQGAGLVAKQGNVYSLDLGRANQITNTFVTAAASEGPRALGGLAPWYVSMAADQITASNIFTGQGYKVGGKAQANPDPGLGDRARIILDDLGSIAFPYRVAKNATQGGKSQGDDSLLGFPKPLKYKPGGTGEANEAERRKMKGNTTQRIVQQVFPTIVPKPDNIVTQAAETRAKGKGTATAKSPAEKILQKHGLHQAGPSAEDILKKHNVPTAGDSPAATILKRHGL